MARKETNVEHNANVETQSSVDGGGVQNGTTVESGNGESQQASNVLVNGAETSASVAKRQAKASVTYVMPAGHEKANADGTVNFPHRDAIAIRIETVGETKRDYSVENLGENVKLCAIQQGLVTRFQRGYQALKLEDDILESIDETILDLDNDLWIEFGTGEPRVTNLINAIVMVLNEEGKAANQPEGFDKEGKPIDSARQKAIGDRLANMSDTERKELRERPAIAANLAELASVAAAKRAAEKRAKVVATATGESASSGF